MHEVIIAFAVQLVVSTVALWLAMKLTKEDGPFWGLFVAAFASSLVNFLPIPYVGWMLSLIVLLVLISKFTSAEIWPDAALSRPRKEIILILAWDSSFPT